jgi:hypothetical protein
VVNEELNDAVVARATCGVEREDAVDDAVHRLAVLERVGDEANVAGARSPVEAQVRELGRDLERARRRRRLGLARDGRHRRGRAGVCVRACVRDRAGRGRDRAVEMAAAADAPAEPAAPSEDNARPGTHPGPARLHHSRRRRPRCALHRPNTAHAYTRVHAHARDPAGRGARSLWLGPSACPVKHAQHCAPHRSTSSCIIFRSTRLPRATCARLETATADTTHL